MNKSFLGDKSINNLNKAIEEAQRFILRAMEYKKRLKKDNWASYGCKEGASCKRASMDLTRELVKVRNPWK